MYARLLLYLTKVLCKIKGYVACSSQACYFPQFLILHESDMIMSEMCF